MKKILLIIFAIVIIFVGSVIFFLMSQNDKSKIAEVVINNEIAPEVEKLVKSGTFNYLDPLHFGEGNVEIIDAGEYYKIKMLANFKSADAPDPHVYLSKPQEFKNRAVAGVDTSKTIDLGELKSFNGEQEYLVSKNDFINHDSAVIIWCKKFGVQISRADLK